MDGAQVLLPCAVGAAAPSESSCNGVDDFPASASVAFGGIIPLSSSVAASIALPRPRGCAVSPPWSFFFTRGTTCFSAASHEASQVSCLDEFFYLIV